MKTRDCAFLVLLVGILLLVSCSVGGAQSAARGAFEEWAQEAGIPYTDVRLETLSDNGTFVTVRVTALLRESAEAGWHEMQADIECRKVAGEWECDQYLYFTLSEAEQERIAQGQEATATAIMTTESMTPASRAPATPMAGEGLRVIAAEIRQEPSEAGFQQYSVRLVFENHGSRCEPLRGEDILRGGTVTTADGYSYPVQVATDTECRWPRKVDAVIPPGFRLRGLVQYDYTTGSSCRSELWAEFEVGATLVPATINLGTYVIDLRSPPQALQYPLIAGPPQLESLPITRLVGSMEVHIGPAEAGPVSTIIDLQYRNTDSGYSYEVVDPVVEIIDDEGWLTTPSLAAGPDWTEPVCPYTVGAAEELGPLQTAMYQSCVLELPQQGERYYLVIASDSDQLTVHEGTYQPSQRLLQAALERAMAAYAADDWIGAARNFEEMLLIQPDHPEASTRLEQIRQGLGTIMYIDDDVVYAISPLGGQPVELFSLADEEPSLLEWSPDGRSAAYIYMNTDGTKLVVARHDGSTRRTIAEGDRTHDLGEDLAWSPDQDRIAFTRYTKGLWSVRIDEGVPEPLGCAADYWVRSVSWSPDGTTIVFGDADSHDTLATDAQGAHCRILTSEFHYDFVWSPLGEQVLAREVAIVLPSVYLGRPDGTGMRKLLGSYYFDVRGLAWSPDGKYIAFGDDFKGIYVVPMALVGEEPLDWTDTIHSVVQGDYLDPVGWVSWMLE